MSAKELNNQTTTPHSEDTNGQTTPTNATNINIKVYNTSQTMTSNVSNVEQTSSTAEIRAHTSEKALSFGENGKCLYVNAKLNKTDGQL